MHACKMVLSEKINGTSGYIYFFQSNQALQKIHKFVNFYYDITTQQGEILIRRKET